MNPLNEILMYGPIGPDFWEPENAITAKSVMAQLSEISGDVTVRISSGGGDVYEGIDIMQALKNHDGKVTVIVESLAASAASFIAVGGADRVLMRPSSELMIHRAWSLVEGNADDARKALGDLERQDNKLAAIYAGKAGGEVADWLDAMSAETWYTAEEAVAAGLADGVITEKSEAPSPSASLAKRRFKFANRAAAPPPPVTRSESGDVSTTPSDGQEGDAMSIKNLAQELGVEPDVLREKLSGFFNEQVEVTTTVDVTYPETVEVVPTGKAEISPEGGPLPEGVAFDVSGPEGWDTTVEETTGVVTVVAPAGAEPDSENTVAVTVTGNGEPVELTVNVVVKAAADKDGDGEPDAPAETAAPVEDTVTLDRDTYNDLQAAAKLGWEAKNQADANAREAEVDTWIREGRINAARRSKVVDAMHRDPQAARELYGSIPVNTIPRVESGYGRDVAPEGDSAVMSTEELDALSKSRLGK